MTFHTFTTDADLRTANLRGAILSYAPLPNAADAGREADVILEEDTPDLYVTGFGKTEIVACFDAHDDWQEGDPSVGEQPGRYWCGTTPLKYVTIGNLVLTRDQALHAWGPDAVKRSEALAADERRRAVE